MQEPIEQPIEQTQEENNNENVILDDEYFVDLILKQQNQPDFWWIY